MKDRDNNNNLAKEIGQKIKFMRNMRHISAVDLGFFFSDSAKTSDNSTDKNFDILANFNHIKDTQIKKSLCGLIKELSEN